MACAILLVVATMPAHALSGTFCTYEAGVVRLNLAADHQVRLLVVDGRIKYADLRDYSQKGPCGRATVFNTDRIRITESDPGKSRLQFDQQLDRFAPGRTREARGRSEIEVNLGTLRDIWIMGRPGSQHVTIGQNGVNLNGDGDADLISSRLAEISVFLNDGDDILSAQGGHGTGDAYLPPFRGYLAVYAGDGDDTLTGTGRADILNGDWGFDTINGLGGGDDLDGGTEADQIRGGSGNDYIDPGSWPDTVFAGPGDDFLAAQDLGPDRLVGGDGFDRAMVDPDDDLTGIEWTSPPN